MRVCLTYSSARRKLIAYIVKQHSQQSLTVMMALMTACAVKVAVISQAVILRPCHYLECSYMESVK